MVKARGLSERERLFVDELLGPANGDATAAAKAVGLAWPNRAGYRMRHRPAVAEEIERRLADHAMCSKEVLYRLTEIARGQMAHFIQVTESGEWSFDLDKAQRANKLHLIHEIASTRYGTRLKLASATEALALLARYHGLLRDRTEITGPDGGPIPIAGPLLILDLLAKDEAEIDLLLAGTEGGETP